MLASASATWWLFSGELDSRLSMVMIMSFSESLQVWNQAGVVEKLDLSKNLLTHLPAEELRRFERLNSLSFAANGIRNWPLPEFPEGCLSQLLDLDVSGNKIQEIPGNAFCSCAASLTSLNLSGELFDLANPLRSNYKERIV